MNQILIHRGEAAKLLHITPNTLSTWRGRGYGPTPIPLKMGIFYLAAEVGEARQDQTVSRPLDDDLIERIEVARADHEARRIEYERTLPHAMSAAEVEAEQAAEAVTQ